MYTHVCHILFTHTRTTPTHTHIQQAKEVVWGLAIKTHLVVVMGTESFDGREHRYVNYPITTVLHMMGQVRARQRKSEGEKRKRESVCVFLVCWCAGWRI